MKLAYGTYSVNQTNMELVAAQAGRMIRVVRVVVTGWAAVSVTLLTDPESDPQPIAPPLHVGPGSGLVLSLGRIGALLTGRGKALGLTSLFQGSAAEFSVAVWYEVVD